MQPKIIFKFNKLLDKKMALVFLNVNQGGVNFSSGIIGVHPELEGITKKSRPKQKKMIDKHFNFFYTKHKKYLNDKVKDYQFNWNSVEKDFFSEVKKIFPNQIKKNIKYVGYLSIIDCNPRFLNNNSFQVFYFHTQGVKYVTAHEILHFIFYQYALSNFSKLFKNLDTENGIFWDLAEMFNIVILSRPQFVKLHGQKNLKPYPQHNKYLNPLKKIWAKERNIDFWIMKGYELLNRKQK